MYHISIWGWAILGVFLMIFWASNGPRWVAGKVETLLRSFVSFTRKTVEEQKAKKAAASKGEVPEDDVKSDRLDHFEESLIEAHQRIAEIWENGQGSWKSIGERLEHESARAASIEGRLQDVELLLHNVANSVSLMAKGENPPAPAEVTNENVVGEEVFLMPGEPAEKE